MQILHAVTGGDPEPVVVMHLVHAHGTAMHLVHRTDRPRAPEGQDMQSLHGDRETGTGCRSCMA
jgi:hypothetical protein